MKKYFDKYELLISILLIIVYLATNSYCLNEFGITDYRNSICNIFLSLIILIFIFINKLSDYYGLTCKIKFRDYLYFIPLLLIVLVSLFGGLRINNSIDEIIFYIISMFGVGFLEEIIFRGFLFKAMAKDNLKSAIMVTSITFGIGHILNLFNGAETIPTLIQVGYAISVGFMFVIIFYKSNNLWPCILTHIFVNSLSIFTIENIYSMYIVPIIWIAITISYSLYILKKVK